MPPPCEFAPDERKPQMATQRTITDQSLLASTRPVTRRAALRLLTLGGMALGLAACTPTPPRTESKPAAPAATTAPAAAAKPAEASKPAAAAPAAASPAAAAASPVAAAASPAAAAKPAEAPKPAAAAPATIKKGGTLIIGADVNPVGLDPHAVTAFSSVAIYEHLYSSLATLDYATNKVKPDLAESWKNVDDKTVEFKLRQGVKFHSGREITAEDVKYTVERILDPKVAAPLISYLGPGIKADVVDKYTVRLSNESPYAPLVSVFADRRPTAIVDREVVEKSGDLKNAVGGSGPFKLVEYTPDVRVVLEKNGDYWEKDFPILDRIEFRFITDETARLAAIRTGEVDMTVLKDPKNARLLRDDKAINLNDVPSFWRSASPFNLDRKPLDDVRVRQAISYAIDRQEMINTVLLGDGVPTGPIPPGEGEWAIPVNAENFPTYQYNPDKARELLKEAGAEGLKISIQAATAYATDIPTAQVMQAQFRKVGIDLQIQQLEWAAVLQAQRDRNFDLNLTFNTNRPDPDTYLSVAHSKFSQNWGKFSDPKVDELIEKGRSTFDVPTRKQTYAEVQKLFATQLPYLYLFVIKNYEPARQHVKGYTPMSSGYRLALKETWVDK
jgi:peptide/nickel transport system substrate-binding protein